jgi:hypothetical protein
MSQQINLYNPIFRKKRKVFSAMTMVQCFGLMVLSAGLLVWYANHQLSELSKQAATATAQLGFNQTRLATINAEFVPRQKARALEDEIRRLEAEVTSLQGASDLLKKNEFGNPKGYSEYLRAFARQSLEGLWLTSFSISARDSEIGLTGRALAPALVPAYINRLATEPVLKGKFFTTLDLHLSPVKPLAPVVLVAAVTPVPVAPPPANSGLSGLAGLLPALQGLPSGTALSTASPQPSAAAAAAKPVPVAVSARYIEFSLQSHSQEEFLDLPGGVGK